MKKKKVQSVAAEAWNKSLYISTFSFKTFIFTHIV
jgi:hypothetical protein